MSRKLKRWLLISGAAILVIAIAAAAALHFAAQALKENIEQALGLESEVGSIALGWSSIEITAIRTKAPQGWPAVDTLRANRVVVAPDLLGLLSAKIRIHRFAIEDGYVSMLRTRDGRLRVAPRLTEASQQTGKSKPQTPVAIGAIELRGCVVELFDASVRQPPHKLRLENVQATIESLQVPDFAGRTGIGLEGVVKGAQHNGTLSVHGWVEIATKDSEVSSKLRGVDLIAFQPYLIKAAETGVRRGTLDLDLNSTVRKNKLRAPGRLTLANLELETGGGAFGTFMGLPRQGVVNALKDRGGKISLQFTLEGDLDDPKFTLNESFARRLSSGFAETLGISFEGLAKGLGSAAQGIGQSVKRLFER